MTPFRKFYIICSSCGGRAINIKRKYSVGELIDPKDFFFDNGDIPKYGAACLCQKCGEPFSLGSMYFREEWSKE